MKTAVSIEDQVFTVAEKTARYMGLSRSRLYSLAVEEYVQNHAADAVTEQLNRIYTENPQALDGDILQCQYDLLEEEDW